MSCDGSGERRWGHPCPGCENCRPAPRRVDFAWGGTPTPAAPAACPWCGADHAKTPACTLKAAS